MKKSILKNQNFWLVVFTAVMAFAMVFQIIILYNQTKILGENSQPPYPSLELELVNRDSNRYFPIWQISGIMANPDNLEGPFFHQREEITFVIVNYGKVKAGIINFDDYFSDKNLTGNAGGITLENQDQKLVDLKFWDNACWGGSGEELYEEARKECGNSALEPGIKNVILKVDCASCINSNNPTCFEFDICIYDEVLKKEWCEQRLPEEDFNFKKIDCPEKVY